MRILVADQNTLLLAAITATFGPHCDLVTATRRDVCLAQLEQHTFDVVIACDKLSDYTGLELLSEVPVISPDTLLIFAANPKRLNQLGKRLAVFGLFDTLSYPLTPQKLVDVLKRARERMGRGVARSVHSSAGPAAARGQQRQRGSNSAVSQTRGAASHPGVSGQAGGANNHPGISTGPAGGATNHLGASMGGYATGAADQPEGPVGHPKVRHVVLESEWDTGERLGLMVRELQAELAAQGRTATHDEWSRAAEAGAAAEEESRGANGDDDFVFEGPPPSVQAMAEPARAPCGTPPGEPSNAPPSRTERPSSPVGGAGIGNRTGAGRTFEGTPVVSPGRTRTDTSAQRSANGVIEYEVRPPVAPGAGRQTRRESVPALTYESSRVAGDEADDFVFAAQPEPIEVVPEPVGIAASPVRTAASHAALEPDAPFSEAPFSEVTFDPEVSFDPDVSFDPEASFESEATFEAENVLDVEPADVPVVEEPSLDDLCGNDPVFEAPSWGPDESANEVAFASKPTIPGAWRRGGTGGTAASARGTAGGTQSGGGYDSRGKHGSAGSTSAHSSRSDAGYPARASRTRDDSRSGHGSGSRARGYNDAHPLGASQGSSRSSTSLSGHASNTPHSAYTYPESPNSSHEAYAYPAPNTPHSAHAHPVAPNTPRSAHAYPAAPNTGQSSHAYPAVPNSAHSARTHSGASGDSSQSTHANSSPNSPPTATRANGSRGPTTAESGRASGSQAAGAAQAGHTSGSQAAGAAQAGRASGLQAAGAAQAGHTSGSQATGAAQAGHVSGAQAVNAAQAGRAGRAQAANAGAAGKATQGAASNGAARAGDVGLAAASKGESQAAMGAQGAASKGAAAGGKATQADAAAAKGQPQRRERTQAVPTASQFAAFERAMARRQSQTSRIGGLESQSPANGKGRRAAKGGVRLEPTLQLGPVAFASAASERLSSSLSDLARMATKKRPLAVPGLGGQKTNRTVFVAGSGLAAMLVLGVLSFELLRNSHEAEHHMPHAQAQSMQVFSSATTLVANREGSNAAQLVAPPPEQTVQPTQENLPQAQTFDPDAAPEDPPPPPALEHPGPMEPPSMDHSGPPIGMMPDSEGSSE